MLLIAYISKIVLDTLPRLREAIGLHTKNMLIWRWIMGLSLIRIIHIELDSNEFRLDLLSNGLDSLIYWFNDFLG